MGNVGSGLQGQCGFAAEGAGNYGTYAVPTRFIDGQAFPLKRKQKVAEGTGLAAGRTVDPAGRYVVTSREATGSLKAEVLMNNLGLLFAHGLGSSATPRNGNGSVNLTTTNASTTVTDPNGTLTPADSGTTLSGNANIPVSATLTYVNPWTGTLSAAATGTATGVATTMTHASYAAYGQSHNLANTVGFSLTTQIGLPDLAGVVHPYTYLGTKVVDLELACELDKIAELSLTLDAQDVTEAQSLAAASYVAAKPFHWGLTNTKIGAFGSEATVEGIRKVSVKVAHQLRTDRFYQDGNAQIKKEPVYKGVDKVTASLDADYVSKADLADRFTSHQQFSLVWSFTDTANIGTSTTPAQLIVSAPACFVEDTFDLSGPDIVTGNIPIVVLNDGVHAPLNITYVSSDVAA